MRDRIDFLTDRQEALRKEHGNRIQEKLQKQDVKIESKPSITFE